jgi:hypothetical protein
MQRYEKASDESIGRRKSERQRVTLSSSKTYKRREAIRVFFVFIGIQAKIISGNLFFTICV